MAAISTLILVAGCGGGGGAAGAERRRGPGGTGISWGSVTGFGSVLVDGAGYSSASGTSPAAKARNRPPPRQCPSISATSCRSAWTRMETRHGKGRRGIDPASPRARHRARAFRGQRVSVRTNTSAAAGPVTYYSGFDGFGPELDGSMLEIHGVYGVDGSNHAYIQASLVRQLPSTTQVRRITGRVDNLDTAARVFKLGDMFIDYDATTTTLPSAAALAEGAVVNM